MYIFTSNSIVIAHDRSASIEIKGIEAKGQKDSLSSRRNGYGETSKNKNEDHTSHSKEDLEQQQISELLYKLPKLDELFEVHRKIGEGTFSSVYLGSLRQHAVVPDSEKRWFAIKHLIPTAHPARIEHELRCLQDIGGKDHVIGVELCLRHLDTIVFIMPYIPHRKFSEYMLDMSANELRRYMRALLTALRRVHSFGVIHRDVKPSNFLYDRENQRYQLVDFGLAQRLCPAPAAPPTPPPAHATNLRKRTRPDEDDSQVEAKRLALDLSLGSRCINNNVPPPVNGVPCVKPKSAVASCAVAAMGGAGAARGACECAGVGGVCATCAARPAARAPRAGTQGFRPPEVLLKVCGQSTAVDVWASGVVLASALTGRYPLLRAADDAAALAELADLLGTAPLQRAAAALGRRLVTSVRRQGLCLRKLCARLRGGARSEAGGDTQGASGGRRAPACPHCRLAEPDCLCLDHTKPAHVFDPYASVCGFPDAAFGLAARLLDPDPRSRISAADALNHPFLATQCSRSPRSNTPPRHP